MKTAVEPIQLPPRKFAHLHVDLVGPFPPSHKGNTHLFTILDRSTRWAEAIPITATTAADCAEALFTGWISRFGLPDLLTSDRGSQFSSEVWAAVCRRLHIKHAMTTAFHPQANGLVERWHRQLKAALRARLCGPDWEVHLPWVMLGLHAAPKDDSGVSAAELLFSSKLVIPGQLLTAPAVEEEQLVRELQSDTSSFIPLPLRPRSYAAVAAGIPDALATAAHVYVRRDGYAPPLSPRYDGPFLVKQRFSKYFAIQMGGRVEHVSVDRLKPHVGATGVTPAEPRRRGRPPAAK